MLDSETGSRGLVQEAVGGTAVMQGGGSCGNGLVGAAHLTTCAGPWLGSVCALQSLWVDPTENYAKCISLQLKIKSYRRGPGKMAQ